MPNTKSQLKNWRKVKLGEVLKIRRGASPRPIHEYISKSGMPWLKIADVTSVESRFVDSTKEFIKEEGVSKSVVVYPGDFILSNSATPGIPKFMRITACVHDGWLILEPKDRQINKDFLYYRLIIDRKKLVSNVTGAIFDNLKTDVLREHEVFFPPENTQKRIAEILSTFDDKIELNNKISKNLEQMAQAIFKEWFIKNEKFKLKNEKLNNLVNIEYGQGPASSQLKRSGYPVYGANGVIGYFDFYDFSDRQIIIGCRGVVGNVTLTLPQCIITHNSLVITPRNNRKLFFYHLLKNQNLGAVVGGSAQPQITITDLERLDLLIPDEKLQDRFESVVGAIEQKRLKVFYENQKLSSLRDLLLPKLMSGEVKV